MRCVGLDPHRIPKHVAIIMDGNGRWAKERGESRVFGHINGIDSVAAPWKRHLELGSEASELYALAPKIGAGPWRR